VKTWILHGWCPSCAGSVPFECSRKEVTTAHGHRLLSALRIRCPEGHEFKGAAAEEILDGRVLSLTAPE
jgi:hypothetical protein